MSSNVFVFIFKTVIEILTCTSSRNVQLILSSLGFQTLLLQEFLLSLSEQGLLGQLFVKVY